MILMALLYFNMVCRITLGNVQFEQVNAVNISQSIKSISDTAKITLPRHFTVKVGDRPEELTRKRILDIIKVGDAVTIELGYDDDLATEFTGYISMISADIPMVIECEDEMYKLRKKTFNETLANAKLSDLVKIIAPGYEYDLIDDISLGKFEMKNATGADVFDALRDQYLLHSYFKGKVLTVGFPADISPGTTHQYNINRNIRQARDLHFVRAEDQKLQIKAISNNSDGSKTVVTVGDEGGATRTLNFANKTQDQLKILADRNLKSLVFDGYTGKLSGFGLPRTVAGDAIEITDPEESGREGTYLTEGVEINFSASVGFERILTPSLKI